jgi:hypothetical protein
MADNRSLAGKAAGALRRFWRWLRGADAPPTLFQIVGGFFGVEVLDKLQTHDKQYPGYDVVSLQRALASFGAECCLEFREVGSSPQAGTMRQLLETFKVAWGRAVRPGSPTYQRVPVDVEEEESVVTNALYLMVMRPEAGADRPRRSASVVGEGPDWEMVPQEERLAVLMTVSPPMDYWDGMETNRVPVMQVNLSVACGDRDAADRFFAEMEKWRKVRSVFRGKVIDPVLHGGVVTAIGFRAIKRVREQDLVLPESVKQLLERSLVGFYSHGEVLRELGVELKRGILLHGPPGTGKTSICLYLAGRLPEHTVCFVSGDRLLHPREICKMARYLQPAMVVFEDIDLVAMERDANGLATVLGELMNQIDGCDMTDQVLFVMNTNSLDRLEGAVRNRPGRVDQIIQVPLPDRAARKQLLLSFARNVKLAGDGLEGVLDGTRDMSPAMLKEIVKRAVVAAVSRAQGKREDVAVQEDDLLLAARQVQAMRDPAPVPGGLGFRPSREEEALADGAERGGE